MPFMFSRRQALLFCMFGAFGAALAALVMAMEEVKVGKNQISLTCFFDVGLFDYPIVKFAA